MDSGVYAACAALTARTQQLDTVANNLANASTSGYRATHDQFRAVLARFGAYPTSALSDAVNDFGVLGESRIDLAQGNLETTGNPLDLGLEGPGFFVVQTPNGRFLTRNGNFHLSQQRQLVTSAGDPVMGEQGTLTLPDGVVNIASDGTISVGGAIVGRLKIVALKSAAELESKGGGYYSSPAANQQTDTATQVRQGSIEDSNVNPVASTVELILIQRNAEMMQRALSIFHNEFNKTATEDLPRIS